MVAEPAEPRPLPPLAGAGRVFIRELRTGRTAWFVWAALLAAATIGFMSLAPVVGSMPQMGDLVKTLPKGLAAALNYDRFSLTAPIGYFATEPYVLIVLFASFHAAVGAASILAKEASDGTAEFLLALPVRRGAVVLGKAAAMTAFTVALHVVLAAALLASFAWFAPDDMRTGLLLRFVLGSMLVALAFQGIALAVSATLTDARTALNLGIGLVWVLYLVRVMGSVVPSVNWLGYFAPFRYADGADIVYNGAPFPWQTAVLLGAWLVGIVAAVVVYARRELRA